MSRNTISVGLFTVAFIMALSGDEVSALFALILFIYIVTQGVE